MPVFTNLFSLLLVSTLPLSGCSQRNNDSSAVETNRHFVAFDSASLQKYSSIYDSMMATAKRTNRQWTVSSSQWIWRTEKDTIKVPSAVSLNDIGETDVHNMIREIKASADLHAAVLTSGWTVAEYVDWTRFIVQALDLVNTEIRMGREFMEGYAKRLNITIRPEIIEFARAHRHRLWELGFVEGKTIAEREELKKQHLDSMSKQ